MIKNIFMGLLVGFVSGLFGSGGGMILVPYLTWSLKDEISGRSTTIFCILFLVLTSSFLYYQYSFIDWAIAIKCSIGGVIGAIVGSKLLLKINPKLLKIVFIIFLIFTGVKMILW